MGQRVVKLSSGEIVQAALVGVMRQANAIRGGFRDAHGAGREGPWQIHVEGALGEAALAKFLGYYWGGFGSRRAPDVGGRYEVKTRSKDWHELTLHPETPDRRACYLLTGSNGTYTVRGWCFGYEGKRPEFWADPAGGRACYFVPQSALHDPEILPKEIPCRPTKSEDTGAASGTSPSSSPSRETDSTGRGSRSRRSAGKGR